MLCVYFAVRTESLNTYNSLVFDPSSVKILLRADWNIVCTGAHLLCLIISRNEVCHEM